MVIIIDGLCPDFTHNTKPIVILVNGLYWHSNELEDLKKIKRYEHNGYRVITLTDEEVYHLPEELILTALIN